MRRPLPVVIALALVAAACGESSADSTTVPTTEPAPEAVQLSYSFEPGTTFQYEVTFDQQLNMSTTGDGAAFGEEEMPGQADLAISGQTTFTHSVEEGAEPGTFDITILGDFTDLAVTGTVDGEPVDSGEIPELADIEPVETTITVDAQGNVISGNQEDLGLGGALGGALGSDPSALGALGSPGMEFGTLIGPPLADREVTVGDTWSETVEEQMPFGEDGITTTVDNEVVGTETLDGAEVLVIETTSTTSLIEFDLAEMMIGFFSAFMPEEATPEERAELEAMTADLRFLMSVDPATYLTTTWFDPEAGHALQADTAGSSRIKFDVNFPDEASGEMVAFAMDMALDQTVSHRLVDVGSA